MKRALFVGGHLLKQGDHAAVAVLNGQRNHQHEGFTD